MNICKLLLNLDNDYNGHFQTIIKGMTTKQGLKLCKKLEKYTNDSYSFVLEIYVDGSFTLLQKDYFKNHSLGHRDRIILGNSQ